MFKVTIELEDNANISEHDIRIVLLDALAEYQSNRGPTAETYVNNRYPGDSVYSGINRIQKIESVKRRKAIAEVLRHFEVEVIK